MNINLGQYMAVSEQLKKVLLENGVREDVVISISDGAVDIESKEENEIRMLDQIKYNYDLVEEDNVVHVCPSCDHELY